MMTPNDLGAPERFSEWRPGQDRAFQHILDSDKRFVVVNAPTGLGKTLLGPLYAKLMGLPTIILTSTKGLQDQYAATVSELSVDLRGAGNYPCKLLLERKHFQRHTPKCDDGPCHDGEECSYEAMGCDYFDAFRRGQIAPTLTTNYPLWFSLLGSNRHLGSRHVLVCDEGHDAPDQVARAVGCELDPKDVEVPAAGPGWEWNEWRTWAEEKLLDVRMSLHDNKALEPWERRRLRKLGRSLARLSHADSTWVKSMSEDGRWTFQPLWPAPFAEQFLFRGIPKVVMLSATITPQTMGYLGVPPESYHYLDLPSPFPAARRPIIHVPTVRVNKGLDDEGMRLWVMRIDQIIRARQDRKGIVHTHSFARARALQELSENRDIMLVPRTGQETAQMVRQFKAGKAPLVLVSPSVATGYDFPYDAARYQIIGKMPFPDLRDPIAAARAKADDNFLTWSAITGLVQMSGRVVRAEDDLGETLIVDDTVNAPWIQKKSARMFPKWWLEAYRSQAFLPPPLPLV